MSLVLEAPYPCMLEERQEDMDVVYSHSFIHLSYLGVSSNKLYSVGKRGLAPNGFSHRNPSHLFQLHERETGKGGRSAPC